MYVHKNGVQIAGFALRFATQHCLGCYIEGLECKGVKSKKVSFEKTEKM